MTTLQELAEIEKRHRTYSATWDDDWDMYKILVEIHADRARLLALLRTARADALEEAAKIAEEYPWNYERYVTNSNSGVQVYEKLRNDVAKAIRSLLPTKEG